MIGAPYKDAYKKYDMTPEGIGKRAKITVDFWKGMYRGLVILIVDVKPIRSPLRRAFEQFI